MPSGMDSQALAASTSTSTVLQVEAAEPDQLTFGHESGVH